MIITSKTNKAVSFINSLKNKKSRKESGLYIVEGKKMLREAFSAGKNVKTVVLCEGVQVDFPLGEAEVLTVSEGVFSYLTDEVTPQGVLAVVVRDNDFSSETGSVSVLLDGLQDPGNMGTIIRTAVAVGVKDIFAVNCCDPYSPKAVRSSMSGIFHVNIRTCDFNSAKNMLGDIPLIVADMCGESVFSFEPPQRYCLVVGNEGNGVSAEVRESAKYTVKIPMSKNSESLNAAISLAVTLYELTEGKNKSLI